jgi:hypothetical protein
LVDPAGAFVTATFIAEPSIVEPSSLLVSGVDMRVDTLHDLFEVTQPVKPVSVPLEPAASVPKSAVGMLCVHPPALPHEIVAPTAAATPCDCVAVSAGAPAAPLSHKTTAAAIRPIADTTRSRRTPMPLR